MVRRDDRTAPRLDPVEPQRLDDADVSTLASAARFDGLRLTGDAADADLSDVGIDECVLERVVLDGARLDGARLTDTVLDGVAATALRGGRLTCRDVRIDGCRIGAAELFEAQWTRVLVTGSRIDYLALTDGALTDVRFADCTIGELDLRGATASRVALDGCRVGSLSLAGAALTAFDLRGAELQRIDGAAHLRGSIVADAHLPLLAPLLAEALGITVR